MNWHTAVATVCNEDGTMETTTLVHIFENAVKQDASVVTAIDHHLLSFLSKKYPTLKEAVLGSDCANCYLTPNTLLPLSLMHQETGIEVKGYFFTEPQGIENILFID
jgi:hypothetical protein